MNKRQLLYLISIFTLLLLLIFSPDFIGVATADPPQKKGPAQDVVKLSKEYKKLDSTLSGLVIEQSSGISPFPAPTKSGSGFITAEKGVRVIVESDAKNKQEVSKAIEDRGGRVEKSHDRLIQATVPIASLKALSELTGVKYIRKPARPIPQNITTQAIDMIGASAWHYLGYTGEGVKVAVVDVGFKDYQSLLGNELPLTVIVKSFRYDEDINAGSDHGTACAEIVHDIAPAAQLYLVNVDTEIDLIRAVEWLIEQGVDIISHSIGWFNVGPGDGSGMFEEIIRRAEENGITWVNAAGNQANRHWCGNFTGVIDEKGNWWHEFSIGDEDNAITGTNLTIALRWNDPWGASANDYDLYLYKDGKEVARSVNPQYGSHNPAEEINLINAAYGTYTIKIQRYSYTDNPNARLDLFVYPSNLEYYVTAGSIISPADSPRVIAVGAVPCSNPTAIEGFSSRGPTVDGRVKPDIVAPDQVWTVTYDIFTGTSAATPHVAGLAALLKQAYTNITPAQILTFLRNSAVDLGEIRADNTFGWGRADIRAGVLTGQVKLQVKTAQSGDGVPQSDDSYPFISIEIGNGTNIKADSNGNFNYFGLKMGVYDVVASRKGFLSAQAKSVTIDIAQLRQLNPVTLLSGDANGDNIIDIIDLSAVSLNMNCIPQTDLTVDFNCDKFVDVYDLVSSAINIGKSGPVEWHY